MSPQRARDRSRQRRCWDSATQLQGELLEARGRCRGDAGAGLGAAGERDGLHLRVFDQALSDLDAGPMDDVQDAWRKLGLPADFRKKIGRHRREFRWLGDDSVPCGQGRRDLPGEKIERKVPGRDAADYPERRAKGVIQRLSPRGMGLGKEMLDGGAEELEIGGGSGNIDLSRRAQGLSGIDRFGVGEYFRPLLDQLGEPAQ